MSTYLYVLGTGERAFNQTHNPVFTRYAPSGEMDSIQVNTQTTQCVESGKGSNRWEQSIVERKTGAEWQLIQFEAPEKWH